MVSKEQIHTHLTPSSSSISHANIAHRVFHSISVFAPPAGPMLYKVYTFTFLWVLKRHMFEDFLKLRIYWLSLALLRDNIKSKYAPVQDHLCSQGSPGVLYLSSMASVQVFYVSKWTSQLCGSKDSLNLCYRFILEGYTLTIFRLLTNVFLIFFFTIVQFSGKKLPTYRIVQVIFHFEIYYYAFTQSIHFIRKTRIPLKNRPGWKHLAKAYFSVHQVW